MVLSTGDLAPWRSGTTSPLPVSLVDYSLKILKKMLLKMAMISLGRDCFSEFCVVDASPTRWRHCCASERPD